MVNDDDDDDDDEEVVEVCIDFVMMLLLDCTNQEVHAQEELKDNGQR